MSRLASVRLLPDFTTEVYRVPTDQNLKRAVIQLHVSNAGANAKLSYAVQQAPLGVNYSTFKKLSADVTKYVANAAYGPSALGIGQRNGLYGFVTGFSASDQVVYQIDSDFVPDIPYYDAAKAGNKVIWHNRGLGGANQAVAFSAANQDITAFKRAVNYGSSGVRARLVGGARGGTALSPGYRFVFLFAPSGEFDYLSGFISGTYDPQTVLADLNSSVSPQYLDSVTGRSSWGYGVYGLPTLVAGLGGPTIKLSAFDPSNLRHLVLCWASGKALSTFTFDDNGNTSTTWQSGPVIPAASNVGSPSWLRCYTAGLIAGKFVLMTSDKRLFYGSYADASFTEIVGSDFSNIDLSYPFMQINGLLYARGLDGFMYSANPASLATIKVWTKCTLDSTPLPNGAWWARAMNAAKYTGMVEYGSDAGVFQAVENYELIDPAGPYETDLDFRVFKDAILLNPGDRLIMKTTGSNTTAHVMGYLEKEVTG